MTKKGFRIHWGGGRVFAKLFFVILVTVLGSVCLSSNVFAEPDTNIIEGISIEQAVTDESNNGEGTTPGDPIQSGETSVGDGNDHTGEETSGPTDSQTDESGSSETESPSDETTSDAETTDSEGVSDSNDETGASTARENSSETGEKSCKKSMGALGWIICPTTGKIAEAIDWLYEKIETVLVINPISGEDGSPIYEIWKYLRGLTNIVFIIFLLIVVYSQITGFGISNYGVKRALPKLVLAAILVNLSFIICSVLVDASNIVGHSLRGVFKSIADGAFTGGIGTDGFSMSSLYSALGGVVGTGVLGVFVAVESGAIWMLIPTILGGIVAVAAGLITVALRQAVVVLLIMIAPLAMVAYILPNTEDLFRKWKRLLTKMLVFYPAFSLLYGASSLAGWAIISSASDGFGILLGVAVQIFPLFFSWSLMKMSGTFLGRINGALSRLGGGIVARNAAWATSHRNLARARNLAKENPFSPTLRLAQFMNNRRVLRDIDTKELNENIAKRGAAYAARSNYRKNGLVSRHGEEAYARQARNMEYEKMIEKYHNDLNEGMGVVNAKVMAELKQDGKLNATAVGRLAASQARLDNLDMRNLKAADRLFDEKARGESIEYENAKGRQERYDKAIHAHFDEQYLANVRRIMRENEGKSESEKQKLPEYAPHFDFFNREGYNEYQESLERYQDIRQTMHGDKVASQYAAATAAAAFDSRNKIYSGRFLKHFEYTEATKDIVYRLGEITKPLDAAKDIDAIVSGMRILNQRGDTDLVKNALDDVLKTSKNANGDTIGGIQLGSHASQALASFLMFEVKDNDPFLRRFGKYINLETAAVYNKGERLNTQLTYDEYVKGVREEYELDENGQLRRDANGNLVTHSVTVKKPMSVLVEGTSLDGIERTAMSNLDDSLRKVYTTEDGNGNKVFDGDNYRRKRNEIIEAIMPAFISSSLKQPSGSEALRSEVTFMTGYTYKQKKTLTGEVERDENGEPVYEWEAAWDARDERGNYKYDETERGKMKKHYREQTMKYLKAQTPSQILGLRSDYRYGLEQHLLDEWLEEHDASWRNEHTDEYNAYTKAVAEAQSNYGDLPPEEAKRKRDADIEVANKKLRGQLKEKHFGEELQTVLDRCGILEQIYRTRRSGAANNAKGWVRDGLGLRNEDYVLDYLERKKEERYREKYGQSMPDERPVASSGDALLNIYSAEDRATLSKYLEDDYNNSDSDDDYFERACKTLRRQLGKNSVILKKFEDHRKYNKTQDRAGLSEEIERIIYDPDNYK